MTSKITVQRNNDGNFPINHQGIVFQVTELHANNHVAIREVQCHINGEPTGAKSIIVETTPEQANQMAWDILGLYAEKLNAVISHPNGEQGIPDHESWYALLYDSKRGGLVLELGAKLPQNTPQEGSHSTEIVNP